MPIPMMYLYAACALISHLYSLFALVKMPTLMDYRTIVRGCCCCCFLNTHKKKKRHSLTLENTRVLSACSQYMYYMSNHTCHFGLGDDPKFEFDMKITLKKHHERRSALKLEGRYSPTRTIRTFPNVSPFAIPSPSESGATK